MLRRRRLRWRRFGILLLAALMAAGLAAGLLLPHNRSAYATERFDRSTALTVTRLTGSDAASRGEARGMTGTWELDEHIDVDDLTLLHANNPTVRTLINGRDLDKTPAGWNPDHQTGDTGTGYPYGQCTWWAYTRRHELGLPVGSRFGDAKDWTASAIKLGYWVDSTPREGDIVVFQPGQQGADAVYGHVAVVEHVDADGGIRVSEANIGGQVGPFQRDITADIASKLEYIHY
nr:CHAP domain-containing protein [Bifidobacterium felsineum]